MFHAVAEAYRKKIQSYSAELQFENLLPEHKQSLLVSDGIGQLQIILQEDGRVGSARHEGFTGTDRIVVDALCKIFIGRPLQEGIEHGCLRVEHFFRDPMTTKPVPGLITPENADPCFRNLIKLVHQLSAMHSMEPTKNAWRDPVPSSWLSLSPQEQIELAATHLQAGARSLGLQEDVQVLEVKNQTRLVLSYKQNLKFPDFGRHMIQLERWIREDMNTPVELQLESMEDRNRRLERRSS
jgi:hypothetical protein